MKHLTYDTWLNIILICLITLIYKNDITNFSTSFNIRLSMNSIINAFNSLHHFIIYWFIQKITLTMRDVKIVQIFIKLKMFCIIIFLYFVFSMTAFYWTWYFDRNCLLDVFQFLSTKHYVDRIDNVQKVTLSRCSNIMK